MVRIELTIPEMGYETCLLENTLYWRFKQKKKKN